MSQSREIVLSYKGNMGVLISFPTRSVLIDGLHEFYRPAYLPTPPAELQKIVSRKDPYANLKLALFTHYHKDHYNAMLASKFLDISKENVVIGSNQVVRARHKLHTGCMVLNLHACIQDDILRPGNW